MRRLRQIHNWLGAFFAPAILFFALSGALQTFNLHENKGGGPYKPPAWIVVMAKLHKDQTLPHPRPPRPAPVANASAGGEDREKGEDRARDRVAQTVAQTQGAAPTPDSRRPDRDKDEGDRDEDAARAPKTAAPGPARAETGSERGEKPAKPKPGPSPLPLKIFVLAVSVALFSTTLLGIWIALKNRSQRNITLVLLAAGTVLPLLLLWV